LEYPWLRKLKTETWQFCLLPGTELSFARGSQKDPFVAGPMPTIRHRTAILRKINALEFPDGRIVLVTFLEVGQKATVLQLPVMHEDASVPEPEKANAWLCARKKSRHSPVIGTSKFVRPQRRDFQNSVKIAT
jgi:hypothetical protein